jgi:hypothetical protein
MGARRGGLYAGNQNCDFERSVILCFALFNPFPLADVANGKEHGYGPRIAQ